MGEGKRGWEGVKGVIEGKGVRGVEWRGWKGIEGVEKRRGEEVGKEREKIVDIQEMLQIAGDIKES